MLCVGLVLSQTLVSGESESFSKRLELAENLVDTGNNELSEKEISNSLDTDEIFKELIVKPSATLILEKLPNATSQAVKKGQQFYEDFWRDKRGALHLAGIIKCATSCDPLLYKGYGCYCGFLGSGEPVDGIDTCCKMHDWCYTTTTCMGFEWNLPYFVPFKWKCNGGAPYCIPGKTRKSDRNSCSHQLCECDREFAMCLQKYLPCPNSKAMCKSKQRLWQNVLMGVGSGNGVHNPYKHHSHHKGQDRYIQHKDIHGKPHHFKPAPLIKIPQPVYPVKGLRLRFG